MNETEGRDFWVKNLIEINASGMTERCAISLYHDLEKARAEIAAVKSAHDAMTAARNEWARRATEQAIKFEAERDSLRASLAAMQGFARQFIEIMDGEEDGGEGIFEERIERLLPEARRLAP